MKKIAIMLLISFILLANSTIIGHHKDLKDVNFYANFTLSTIGSSVQIRPSIQLSGGAILSLAQLQTENPTMKYQTDIAKNEKHIKWAMNFTKIPFLTVSGIQGIYLDFDKIKYISNTTFEKLAVFFDDLILSFKDLQRSGFNVFWVNKTRLFIGNITANLKANSLLLDPTIFYSCGGIIWTGGYYELNETLNCDGTAVNIFGDPDVENVVFDCKGFTINYANGGDGFGIIAGAASYSNLLIKNCIIQENGYFGGNYGILLSGDGSNVTLLNSTIQTYSDTSMAVYTILSELNISNSRIIMPTMGTAVYIQDGVGIQTIYNTYIEKSVSIGYALFFDATYAGYIVNTIINVTSTEGSGIYLNENVTFDNLTFFTIGENSSLANGIVDDNRGGIRNVFNNSFINSTDSNLPCVLFKGGSKNDLIENTTINCPIIAEFQSNENGCSNASFLNSTFSRSKFKMGTACNATAKIGWYGRVNVTNETGAAQLSLVNITDVFGTSEFYGNTSGTGLTGSIAVWQFWFNGSQTLIDFGNHTFKASKAGYASNSTSKNITAPFFINLILMRIISTGTQTFIYYGDLNDSMLSLILAMGFISFIFAFLFYSSDKNNTAFRLTFLIFTILSVVMMAWIAYATLGTTTTVNTYDSTGTLTGTNVVSNSNTAVDLSFQTYLELVNYLPYIIFTAMLMVVLYNLLVSYNQKYQGAS